MRLAAKPSNITEVDLPLRFVPITVPSEPATSGVGLNVAAFTIRVTVTEGLDGGVPLPEPVPVPLPEPEPVPLPVPLPLDPELPGAAETFRVTGTETDPASAPASMMTFAV